MSMCCYFTLLVVFFFVGDDRVVVVAVLVLAFGDDEFVFVVLVGLVVDFEPVLVVAAGNEGAVLVVFGFCSCRCRWCCW